MLLLISNILKLTIMNIKHPKTAFAKFIAALVKSIFQSSNNADFYRLKNFIC